MNIMHTEVLTFVFNQNRFSYKCLLNNVFSYFPCTTMLVAQNLNKDIYKAVFIYTQCLCEHTNDKYKYTKLSRY